MGEGSSSSSSMGDCGGSTESFAMLSACCLQEGASAEMEGSFDGSEKGSPNRGSAAMQCLTALIKASILIVK